MSQSYIDLSESFSNEEKGRIQTFIDIAREHGLTARVREDGIGLELFSTDDPDARSTFAPFSIITQVTL